MKMWSLLLLLMTCFCYEDTWHRIVWIASAFAEFCPHTYLKSPMLEAVASFWKDRLCIPRVGVVSFQENKRLRERVSDLEQTLSIVQTAQVG